MASKKPNPPTPSRAAPLSAIDFLESRVAPSAPRVAPGLRNYEKAKLDALTKTLKYNLQSKPTKKPTQKTKSAVSKRAIYPSAIERGADRPSSQSYPPHTLYPPFPLSQQSEMTFKALAPFVAQWSNKQGILTQTRASLNDLFLSKSPLSAVACMTSHLNNEYFAQVYSDLYAVQNSYVDDPNKVLQLFDSFFSLDIQSPVHLFFSLVYFAQTVLTLSTGSLIPIEYITHANPSSFQRDIQASFRSNKETVCSLSILQDTITMQFAGFSFPLVPETSPSQVPFLPATFTAIPFIFAQTIDTYASPLSQALFYLAIVLEESFRSPSKYNTFPLLVQDKQSFSPFLVEYAANKATIYTDRHNVIQQFLSKQSTHLLDLLISLAKEKPSYRVNAFEHHGRQWRSNKVSFTLPLPGSAACMALEPYSMAFSNLMQEFPDVDDNFLMPQTRGSSTVSIYLAQNEDTLYEVAQKLVDSIALLSQDPSLSQSMQDLSFLADKFQQVLGDIFFERVRYPVANVTDFDLRNAVDVALVKLNDVFQLLGPMMPLLQDAASQNGSIKEFVDMQPLESVRKTIISLQNYQYNAGQDFSEQDVSIPSASSESSEDIALSPVESDDSFITGSGSYEPLEDEELPEPDYDQF